jgi:hypothetical protein
MHVSDENATVKIPEGKRPLERGEDGRIVLKWNTVANIRIP